jgi:hypothetical protein
MSNKKLGILLAALAVIYLLTQLFSNQGTRSFDEVFVSLDSAKIHQVIFYPNDTHTEEIKLQRTGSDSWSVSNGIITVPATGNMVNSVLNNLRDVKTERVVAKSENKWADYNIDATKGRRIQALDKAGKTLTDITLGRFSFNQQTRSSLSFVRKSDEKDVIAVNGWLSMSLNTEFSAFRNKELANVNAEDINKITISGSNPLSLEKENNLWKDQSGNILDSIKVAGYLSNFRMLSGTEFADNFNPAGQSPIQTISILANNQIGPVDLDVYEYLGGSKPFVFHSNLNPESWFIGDSTGVYQKVITSLTELISE